jgi:opacity protein-like surface antigen
MAGRRNFGDGLCEMERAMNERMATEHRRLRGHASYLALVAGLIAAAGPALAVDLSLPPAIVSAPADTPKPPPIPLAVFGDNMPDPDKATFSIIPTFANFSHMMVGTKGVTSQQVVTGYGWYWNPAFSTLRVVPTNNFQENQTVTLAYGIAKDWSVVVTTGVVERHSDLVIFNGAGSFASYPFSSLIARGTSYPGIDNIQDSSAAIIWRPYDDGMNRIKINLGMSFPTGNNHNNGGVVMQTTGSYAINQAFYGMQPGTGTFDVMPGILYGGVKDQWSWGLSYRARLPLGVNPEGYMWGNYQEANAWGGYTWLPGFTTTVRANFNIQDHITGADWWLVGKLPSANPNYYGGKRIEMYAGADIDGKLFGYPGFSIGVEAGVPVYQNLNGPQISKNWQAGLAARWKFGDPVSAPAVAGSPIFKGPQVAAAPISPWRGFYVGINSGYTWANDTNTNFTYMGQGGFASLWSAGGLPSNVTLNSQGFIGGVQVGYNYPVYEKVIAGLEADLQGLTVGNSNTNTWQGSPATYLQAARNQHSLGTVRGRVGYLATPTMLLYATGGLAYGENNLNATYFSPLLKPILYQGGSWLGTTDLSTGFTAGVGAEWMFLPRWSLKAEYLYYDLGTANTANFGPVFYTSGKALSTAGYSAPFDGHIIRAGVNYHFNGASPEAIIAKY